jgi:hypothetical protein
LPTRDGVPLDGIVLAPSRRHEASTDWSGERRSKHMPRPFEETPMKLVSATASMLLASAVMFGAATATAYGNGTPDEQPPAEEQVCEDAGLFGSALGLCVAFCEANDCDANVDGADDRACSSLRAKYARVTGELFLPCEGSSEPQ